MESKTQSSLEAFEKYLEETPKEELEQIAEEVRERYPDDAFKQALTPAAYKSFKYMQFLYEEYGLKHK